ncbi:hypothetical protein NIES592_08330 [Fischerella major NIES-592]|uniref:Uncharacterized protein n=1 Tax=Fischerella major NIES-592 TaxID=210994 RepID=A0A1U7H1M5_9CYAN|nr:hypothetical protein [Fischerella major]OKH14874.1 hypothetical protein NIES592_08330 [Fischerella major NIES-592]
MSETTVFIPDYYRVLERRSGEWFLKKAKVLVRNLPIAIDFDDFELLYGISREKVAIELFRINGGRDGYYLVNLRQKRYYYCGTEPEGVKTQLRELGIGRDDPIP